MHHQKSFPFLPFAGHVPEVGTQGREDLVSLHGLPGNRQPCVFLHYRPLPSRVHMSPNHIQTGFCKKKTQSAFVGGTAIFLVSGHRFSFCQVTDEKFLVYLNDLLSSGNIADLFPVEDKVACSSLAGLVLLLLRVSMEIAASMDSRCDHHGGHHINPSLERCHR